MRTNKLKAIWKQDKPTTMAWLSTADTYVAEVVGNAGFDAVVLDTQHGMTIGPDRTGMWLQAMAATPATPVVRVPWNQPHLAQWALDAGAMGIIFPLINNKEEAIKAVGSCKYPPLGYRSSGQNRARFLGDDYLKKSNDEIAVILMIEDIRTVNRIEEIVSVPGIDSLYIGPADLAFSMGIMPSEYPTSSTHAKACQHILHVAKAHGIWAGVHCNTAEEAAERAKQGFLLSPSFNDISALESASAAALKIAHGKK